ncbi:MAG TPA: hypothetical protein VLC46_26840 [Thermoanaerobaculia bacterium]|nr:hypothetical protein [Thermoanaerobaculia bacterium]
MSDIPNLPTETEVQPETVQTPQPASEPTVPSTPPAAPIADPVDYRTKFAESTRENQVLAARLAEAEKKSRQELTTEPTDSDLRAAFPEWEYMDDVAKRSATLAFKADRRSAAVAAEREAEKAERSWQNDLEIAVAAHPELGEKAREFKDYASKPSHRGAPIEVLISAFKNDSTTMTTPQPETPAPGLLGGNGGPREPEKPKTLSGDELKALRESDERAWREYVSTHEIDPDAL